jgi:hypothetical protein
MTHVTVSAAGLSPQTVMVTQAKSNDVPEADAPGIRIYPNPNRGIFNILTKGGTRLDLYIAVEDMNGNVVLKEHLKGSTEYTIDLSTAASGTYNVIMKTDTYLVNRKIVILR